MIQYLEELKGIGEKPLSVEESEELEKLRKAYAKMKPKEEKKAESSDEESSDNDDDYVDELPAEKIKSR